ncbi:MAG: hypothetical protein N2Z65_04970 [Clostridiales bacterium]|nr:hypothetical protein [Clostridiales bacterium]
MSIIISGLRLPLESDDYEAFSLALSRAGLLKSDVRSLSIYKRSFDARHGKITKVLSVLINAPEVENEIISRASKSEVRKKAEPYRIIPKGKKTLSTPPVIIGFGPAGIFAGLMLAKHGYRPIILEKGSEISRRDQAVSDFFSRGSLDETSNIQFGEGGAGTYSDGKLTTRISDERCELVLSELCNHGAPEEILQLSKPHIGTDLLKEIIKSIRREILSLGGEIRFSTEVTDFEIRDNALCAIKTGEEKITCEKAILAIGHSSRNTFEKLLKSGVSISQKSFAVGLRIEHRQDAINRAMYGKYADHPILPPAEYNLTDYQNGRSCYSFCMCPGGSVVAAASEEGTVVVNGMSLHARNGENANSAIVVSVTPEDFESNHPLSGVSFQRKIERSAFTLGGENYFAPCQLVGDFIKGIPSKKSGMITPSYPIGVTFCDLSGIFPDFISDTIRKSLIIFDKKIKGFGFEEALLTAPETRTSSPVRIVRNQETMESITVSNLIPCGEGAGYAGGIISAAVDGIRAAERIMEEYKPLED